MRESAIEVLAQALAGGDFDLDPTYWRDESERLIIELEVAGYNIIGPRNENKGTQES